MLSSFCCRCCRVHLTQSAAAPGQWPRMRLMECVRLRVKDVESADLGFGPSDFEFRIWRDGKLLLQLP